MAVPSQEFREFIRRQRSRDASDRHELRVYQPVRRERETHCHDCGVKCPENDRDRHGHFRCRKCGLEYLDRCIKEATESQK